MPEWLDPLLLQSWKFLDSNLMTSFIGSVAGAFGGAWAAQRIAERSKQRDDILKEIRNTNAAIALAISITNTFLGMKRQHVKRLFDNFHKTKAEVEKQIQERQGPIIVNFRADLETLSPTDTPIEQLEQHVFDKISLDPRALMLIPVLSNAIRSFNMSLETRNDLINKWKGRLSEPELAPLYFGWPHKGNVDQTYPSIIDAIHSYSDDVIAFSRMVGEALNTHGNRQQKEFSKRFKGKLPAVSRFDLSKGEDILPPAANYADWQWIFEKETTPPQGWRARLSSKLRLPRFGSGH